MWRRSRQAHERVSPERDAPATKSSGCPRPKAEPSGAQAAARAALAGASGVCKRTQTAGEIALGWPEDRCEKDGDKIIQYWHHSDIKNVSYYYVYKLFEKIIKEN